MAVPVGGGFGGGGGGLPIPGGGGGGGGGGSPTDPLYKDQWHLKNTGQLGANGVAVVAPDVVVPRLENSEGTR